MARVVSAKRYAQAVLQIAIERDEVDQWLGDLEILASSTGNNEFALFADSPKIPTSDKIKVLQEAFGGSISQLALNLAFLLASRNAIGSLPEIADAFEDFVDKGKGLERAEITTSLQVDQDTIDEITEVLKNKVGKELLISTKVDPNILGGFVAKVGDRVIDGSVRTQFENMRRHITQGN